MKKYVFLCLVLAARCVSAQDGPAVDARTMLAALKEIKVKHETSASMRSNKLRQELNTAASSNSNAIAYYMEAMYAMGFAGKSHAQTYFQDWKKKEAEHLKSPEMQTAVRLHLNYLILTLARAQDRKISELLPEVIRYCDQAAAASHEVLRQDILRSDITGSIFVKWHGIESSLGDMEGWSTHPGNVDEIWEKTILPQLRKDKDPRVITYWDNKIRNGADVMSESDRSFDVQQFNETYKPQLLWSRAEDLILIGRRNAGLSEMFAIVKNWPEHRSNLEWIGKLEKNLTGPDAGAGEK